MDVPSLTGKLVAEWREAQGLTQEALAAKIGRGRGTITQIETGSSSQTVTTLLTLAKALDVPGRNDTERLARFFEGPEVAQALERLEEAVDDAERLLGSTPRRRR